jgi:hypothetical protein
MGLGSPARTAAAGLALDVDVPMIGFPYSAMIDHRDVWYAAAEGMTASLPPAPCWPL